MATNEGGSSAPSNVVSETTKKGASDGGVIEGDGSLGGVEAVEVDAGAQDGGSSLAPETVAVVEPSAEVETAVVESSAEPEAAAIAG